MFIQELSILMKGYKGQFCNPLLFQYPNIHQQLNTDFQSFVKFSILCTYYIQAMASCNKEEFSSFTPIAAHHSNSGLSEQTIKTASEPIQFFLCGGCKRLAILGSKFQYAPHLIRSICRIKDSCFWSKKNSYYIFPGFAYLLHNRNQ